MRLCVRLLSFLYPKYVFVFWEFPELLSFCIWRVSLILNTTRVILETRSVCFVGARILLRDFSVKLELVKKWAVM